MAHEPSSPPRWLPGSGGIVATLVLNIALPTATYFVLSGAVGQIPALLISSLWPALELLVSTVRRRRVDELSIVVIAGLLLGVLATVLSSNARAVFIKDWAIWGLFGVTLLASLLAPRPIMFYFGRRFATDGSATQREWWDSLWQYGEFRRAQRLLTLVWGAVLCVESAVGAVLTWRLGTAPMVVVDNLLPYGVIAALVGGTAVWAKRGAAARARRMSAARDS